jgi:hypothetical protein
MARRHAGLARCRILPVQGPIINPHVQTESKEICTTWVPGSRRRKEDAPDIARLRQALRRATPRAKT